MALPSRHSLIPSIGWNSQIPNLIIHHQTTTTKKLHSLIPIQPRTIYFSTDRPVRSEKRALGFRASRSISHGRAPDLPSHLRSHEKWLLSREEFRSLGILFLMNNETIVQREREIPKEKGKESRNQPRDELHGCLRDSEEGETARPLIYPAERGGPICAKINLWAYF
jgi:hypothetical protein